MYFNQDYGDRDGDIVVNDGELLDDAYTWNYNNIVEYLICSIDTDLLNDLQSICTCIKTLLQIYCISLSIFLHQPVSYHVYYNIFYNIY